jgi:folate-binding protein YgfZ
MDAERYRDFQRRGGIIDLADRLKLLFKGEDRLRYLNGQVTANLLAAKNPGVVPACVTTAKGKLCADAFVSLGPSGILIDADPSLAETLPPRMERYIVADDVTMEDVTESTAIVHCIGMKAEALADLTGLTPVAVSRYGLPGFDLFPPFRSDLPPIWSKLRGEYPILDSEFLETVRIERGVPRWGRELNEDTLPPEAGLDRTHIDYTKGCYIGQEVISRLKSVGHVNRRLVGFISRDGTPLAQGCEVRAASTGDTAHGTITSATLSFALEKEIALGYLRRSAPVDDLLAVITGSEPVPITLCNLPFIS